MSAADRLEAALFQATEALLDVVGLAANPADHYGPRVPVSGSCVNVDEVPVRAWRAAILAQDVLALGLDVLDPESTLSDDLDAELAAITEGRGE